jgi:hypothetical protein
MKIVVTTSNAYAHIVPIFLRLYNREWGEPFDLVGYDKQVCPLPDNCTWVSLGKQRGPKYFSDDLRPYFEKQDQWFVWLFEDSFIRSVDKKRIHGVMEGASSNIGRFCLSNEGMNRQHEISVCGGLWKADPKSLYRLSTQPSIWNRDFLLHYLTPGLSPWAFEKQETIDNWQIIGPVESIVTHNEGVTKKDIHKLNLKGITL